MCGTTVELEQGSELSHWLSNPRSHPQENRSQTRHHANLHSDARRPHLLGDALKKIAASSFCPKASLDFLEPRSLLPLPSDIETISLRQRDSARSPTHHFPRQRDPKCLVFRMERTQEVTDAQWRTLRST